MSSSPNLSQSPSNSILLQSVEIPEIASGFITIGTRAIDSWTMAEEIALADLEMAHEKLAQKLQAQVMKREVFELKFQEQITSMAVNINDKLDGLLQSLDSFKLQLLNFGKGKLVDDVGNLGQLLGDLQVYSLKIFAINRNNLPTTTCNSSKHVKNL